MTIISIDEQILDRRRKKRHIVLRCDDCNKIYVCETRYKNRALNSTLHFCSKSCSNKSIKNGLLKNRVHQAIIDKYGSYYVETDLFKKEQIRQCLSIYGVKSRLEAQEILDKIKITCIEKYGQETYAGSDDHQSKLDYDDISKKAWQTKIKNGSCSKSKVEERIYQILTDKFGLQNIDRQIHTIKQWVDFYIKSLNLYLQVDGTYWHGLNRPREIIALQKTSQDKKIYKQILRDEKLNQYMKNNNLKLLRLTDEVINSSSDEEIFNIIKENSYGNI